MPNKDDFHLELDVSFKADEADLKSLEAELKKHAQITLNFGGDDGKLEEVLDEHVENIREVLESDDTHKSLINANFLGNIKSQVFTKLTSVASGFVSSLGSLFTDAWDELGTMLDSSLMSNQTTRDNAFTYGFSASENYGFEKAKKMLGIKSEEDLMYMNNVEQEKFQEIMTKYTEKYDSLYDKGFFDKYQEFQIEMEEFKLDMQMEVIEFFMENKDTIKSFLKLAMEGMKFIVEALGWLMDHFGNQKSSDETKVSNINDIINSYTTNNSSNATINQNNTVNMTGSTASQQQSLLDTLSSWVTAGISALGG